MGPMNGIVPQIVFHHEPTQVQENTQVPARVKVAAGFLQHLTSKTADVPLPQKSMGESDISFEAIPGQKLTDEEKDTQRAALRLLEDYFNGVLKPSEWEKKEIGWEENAPGKKKDNLPMRINCPGCRQRGESSNDCILCRGRGEIMAGLVR